MERGEERMLEWEDCCVETTLSSVCMLCGVSQ